MGGRRCEVGGTILLYLVHHGVEFVLGTCGTVPSSIVLFCGLALSADWF